MTYETLLYEERDAVAWVTLNRPDVHNAFNGTMMRELSEVWRSLRGNDAINVAVLTAAGEKSGEKMWRMPIIESYLEGMRSNVADIKNTGARNGGAINAAEFLRFFVGDTEWAHIDMAGTDDSEKEKGVWVKGSTGIPTRTLINFVLAWAEKKQ